MEITGKSEAEGPSPLKRAAIVILALALLGLVVAAVLLADRMRSGAGRQIVTLPDGSRLELLGTGPGNDSFTTGKPWHGVARRLLPGRLKNWIPTSLTIRCGGATNSLAVYVRHLTPTATAGGLTPWNSVEAEDASGFRYGRNGGYCSLGALSGSVVYGANLRSFPRREEEFLVRFASGSTLVATFRVSNPFRGPFPEWKPAPLPQTQTNGPVSLTLRGLKMQGSAAQPQMTESWKLEAADNTPWTNSRVWSVTYSDATGNEGQSLSPREPAWKIRATVARQRPEDFSAREKMTLTNLPIPAAGNFVSLDQTADCDGVRFSVQVIAGAGELVTSNGVSRSMQPRASPRHGISIQGTNRIESWGSNKPFFVIEARNTLEGDEIQFHLRDDQNRELKAPYSGSSGGSSGTRVYQPQFTPADDAKSLTLVIILNRPLPFEFMVNPADITQTTKQ